MNKAINVNYTIYLVQNIKHDLQMKQVRVQNGVHLSHSLLYLMDHFLPMLNLENKYYTSITSLKNEHPKGGKREEKVSSIYMLVSISNM